MPQDSSKSFEVNGDLESHLKKAEGLYSEKQYYLSARSFGEALEIEELNQRARDGINKINAQLCKEGW